MLLKRKRVIWKSSRRGISTLHSWSRIVIVFLLLLPIPLVSSMMLPQAHAEGVIYLSNKISTTSKIFTTRIQVAAADPFNSWNIQIQANQSVISPVAASISGNTLDANYTENILQTVNCINGINLTASHCDNSDGPGIVHSAAMARQTNPPAGSVYGLLLTINYTVVLSGFYSPLHFLRAVISDGAKPVPLQVLDGFYGIPPGQDFGFKASSMSERILLGSEATVTLTVSTSGGYHGRVDLTSQTSDSAIGAHLNETYTQVYPNSPRNLTLTITTSSGSKPDQHTINVTATSNGLSRSAVIKVTTIDKPDFILKASPPTLRIGPNATGISIIRLESESGFSGAVDLGLGLPQVAGLKVSLNPLVVTMTSDGSTTAVLDVTAPNSPVPFLYLLNITGTSESSSSASTLTVSVKPPDPDFTFSIQASELETIAGQSITSVLTVTSIDYFKGHLRFIASTVLGGEAEFNPPDLSIDFGNSYKSTLTLATGQKSPAGRYNVALTAIGTTNSGANVTHAIVVHVTIDRPVASVAFLSPESVGYLSLIGAFSLVSVALIVKLANKEKGYASASLRVSPSFDLLCDRKDQAGYFLKPVSSRVPFF